MGFVTYIPHILCLELNGTLKNWFAVLHGFEHFSCFLGKSINRFEMTWPWSRQTDLCKMALQLCQDQNQFLPLKWIWNPKLVFHCKINFQLFPNEFSHQTETDLCACQIHFTLTKNEFWVAKINFEQQKLVFLKKINFAVLPKSGGWVPDVCLRIWQSLARWSGAPHSWQPR